MNREPSVHDAVVFRNSAVLPEAVVLDDCAPQKLDRGQLDQLEAREAGYGMIGARSRW
jgi:hypothetical protein